MVAIMKFGKSLRRTLTYNENKVDKGVAECISAVNYPKDLDMLTFNNKLNRLTRQAALRTTVKKPSVHISLNFHPTEVISKEKMSEIADAYMRKMGLDDLPYLVYQHHDAGHPHIHIVSVKIRDTNERVETNFIGRDRSDPVRKEIEKEFGLIEADGHGSGEKEWIQPVNIQKAIYGISETKRAITVVLEEVFEKYKFSSFEEYNAILYKYNVYADRGQPDSITYRKRGLRYGMLDERGNRIGIPIKASDFFNKPTLSEVENKFAANKLAKYEHKGNITSKIDRYFNANPKPTLNGMTDYLLRSGIGIVMRTNSQGRHYGITYVDYYKKTVFNGSDLGKYAIKDIMNRIDKSSGDKQSAAIPIGNKYAQASSAVTGSSKSGLDQNRTSAPRSPFLKSFAQIPYRHYPIGQIGSTFTLGHSGESILDPVDNYQPTPWELRRSRRKGKKKRAH